MSGAVFIVFLSILTLEFTETKCNLKNSDRLLRSATPVKDDDCRRLIASLCLDEYLSNFEAKLDVSGCYEEFLHWVSGSSKVAFAPPPRFQPMMSSGITEAFNDFYIRHAQRDLFVLRGEYPYHKDVFESLQRPYFDLAKTPLTENACVILSLPFSATGDIHPQTQSILEECSRLHIPVMLDLAFLGLGTEVAVDYFLHYSCIDGFAFSFSKMFSLGRARAGWTWLASPTGSLHVLSQWKYNNWLGHYVAQACLRHFTFDHMSEKYAPLQRKLCAELNLMPSSSYLFGIGDDDYRAFSRQGTANRVCISPLLESESVLPLRRSLDSSPEST